jgi:hypothetical protein
MEKKKIEEHTPFIVFPEIHNNKEHYLLPIIKSTLLRTLKEKLTLLIPLSR